MTLWQYLREWRQPVTVENLGNDDKPWLGRHVWHDPRSRRYDARKLIPCGAQAPVKHIRHKRTIPVFDQGELGCCTAAAALGMLMTGPFSDAVRARTKDAADGFDLDEVHAFYSAETFLDNTEIAGQWPPTDTGSTGLWSMKLAALRGYLTRGYYHAFRWTDVVKLLRQQPLSVGVGWYESFNEPDNKGWLRIAGQVEGGHQFVVDEIIPRLDGTEFDVGLTNSWGPTWGVEGRAYMTGATFRQLLREGGDVVTGRL